MIVERRCYPRLRSKLKASALPTKPLTQTHLYDLLHAWTARTLVFRGIEQMIHVVKRLVVADRSLHTLVEEFTWPLVHLHHYYKHILALVIV